MDSHRRLVRLLSVALCAALTALIAPSAASAAFGYRTQWGSEGTAPGQFEWATGLAVGPDDKVYVADDQNQRKR